MKFLACLTLLVSVSSCSIPSFMNDIHSFKLIEKLELDIQDGKDP
jgi:hypothetical protein